MLKPRKELEDYLQTRFKKISDVQIVRDICKNINETYDIPISIVSDFVSLRISGEELSEFILFAILQEIKDGNVNEYYTETEISTYSSTKYKANDKVSFPIRIKNMAKIADDQYIGAISLKELMMFRNSQLINYNENSQRTMKRLVKGNNEFYQISLNKQAVSEIRELIEKQYYIPNTITFNMPEDTEYTYVNGDLVIKEITHFDILDGYHRYIAMSQIYDIDNSFDYPMELRVVMFHEEKAKQFIFQEDQKTKMKKTESDTFNQYNAGNIVSERLNIDPKCDIAGMISRNGGMILSSEFNNFVNYFWFKGVNKKNEKQAIRDTVAKIREIFNILADEYDEILNEKYNTRKTLAVVYTCYISTPENAAENYLKLINALNEYDGLIFSNGHIRRIVINTMKNALKGDD